MGATSLLSKRCLCSRETEGALHPGQQRPPWPQAAHLGLLLELGHVQEHLCDLPVEHAHTVPAQEEGAVLINIHLQEGDRSRGRLSHRPRGGPCPSLAGRAHGRSCAGAQPSPSPSTGCSGRGLPLRRGRQSQDRSPEPRLSCPQGRRSPPPQGTPAPRGLQWPRVILRALRKPSVYLTRKTCSKAF